MHEKGSHKPDFVSFLKHIQNVFIEFYLKIHNNHNYFKMRVKISRNLFINPVNK